MTSFFIFSRDITRASEPNPLHISPAIGLQVKDNGNISIFGDGLTVSPTSFFDIA